MSEMKWQPIETAPKDGREILLFDRDDLPTVFAGKWAPVAGDGGWWIYADELLQDACAEAFPTHWMPLPPPPEREE